MAASIGNSPAAGVGDFCEPAAVVHAFEQAANGGALASLFGALALAGLSSGLARARGRMRGVCRRGEERGADVLISEAAGDAVAVENGGEGADVFASGGVEAGEASAVDFFRLSQLPKFLVGRRGIVDDSQGVEIAAVAGAGVLLVVAEAGDVFAHGEIAFGGRAVAMVTGAKDGEVFGAVDDGFDAEDESELVVHFEPVAFDAMLDARAEEAVGFGFGLEFAVETTIVLTSEEAIDVLGSERQGGELQEFLIEPAQGGAAVKEQVGGELGLIDEPVGLLAGELLTQEGVDQAGVAVEDFVPVEGGETIGLALRFGGVVELREGVVLKDEAHLQTGHLLGEPIVAVDADLQRIRSPGLQADMDQAQLFIEKVVVEDALPPRHGHEARPRRGEFEGKRIAGFHGAQDADEAAVDALFAQDFLGPLVLAKGTRAIEKSPVGFAGPTLGVSDERIGVLGRQDLDEMVTSNAEEVIDEAFQLGRPSQR